MNIIDLSKVLMPLLFNVKLKSCWGFFLGGGGLQNRNWGVVGEFFKKTPK